MLYKSIAEKENLSNLALEKRIGLPNGTIGRAIERNSAIKPAVFAQIAKAFPHLDLNQLQIELLAPSKYAASGTEQSTVSEPDNENAPSDSGRGEEMSMKELVAMTNKAVQAATEAAQAATKMAGHIDALMSEHEARIGASETMIVALQEFAAERYAQSENTTLQEARAVLGKKVIDVANRKKKGTQLAGST